MNGRKPSKLIYEKNQKNSEAAENSTDKLSAKGYTAEPHNSKEILHMCHTVVVLTKTVQLTLQRLLHGCLLQYTTEGHCVASNHIHYMEEPDILK